MWLKCQWWSTVDLAYRTMYLSGFDSHWGVGKPFKTIIAGFKSVLLRSIFRWGGTVRMSSGHNADRNRTVCLIYRQEILLKTITIAIAIAIQFVFFFILLLLSAPKWKCSNFFYEHWFISIFFIPFFWTIINVRFVTMTNCKLFSMRSFYVISK